MNQDLGRTKSALKLLSLGIQTLVNIIHSLYYGLSIDKYTSSQPDTWTWRHQQENQFTLCASYGSKGIWKLK